MLGNQNKSPEILSIINASDLYCTMKAVFNDESAK